MTVELAALARLAQAGDPAARQALLVELYGSVRKHLYLVFGAGALADDAVQETMLALHRSLSRFRGDTASPRTWALAIATRSPIGCTAGSRATQSATPRSRREVGALQRKGTPKSLAVRHGDRRRGGTVEEMRQASTALMEVVPTEPTEVPKR